MSPSGSTTGSARAAGRGVGDDPGEVDSRQRRYRPALGELGGDRSSLLGVNSGEAEHGRQDVDMAGQRIELRGLRRGVAAAREAHHHRHVQRLLIGGVPFLDHHAVRGAIFAMIGEEEDDRIVRLAQFLERGQHRIDMDVDDRVKPSVELQEQKAVGVGIVGELERDAALQRQRHRRFHFMVAARLRPGIFDRGNEAVDDVEPALGGEREADLVGGLVLAGRLAGERFVLGRRGPGAILREAERVERDLDRAGDGRRRRLAFARHGQRAEERLGAGRRLGIGQRLGDHAGIGRDVVRVGERGDREPGRNVARVGAGRVSDPRRASRRRPGRS